MFGGEGNQTVKSGVFNQIEACDTARNACTSMGKIRILRHGTCAIGFERRRIYLRGGGVPQGGALVADFDVFAP